MAPKSLFSLVVLAIWFAWWDAVYCTTDGSLFRAGSAAYSGIAALESAARNTIQKNSSNDFSAAYLTSINGTTYASIYTNWPDAIFFESGMNIDCDGPDWQYGQPVTTYGNLSAYDVPYIVVPASYVDRKNIPPNAISAVICNGQMYYAIMGDTNGDTPQVMGEASWLLGQTCFPNDALSGGNAHDKMDVLYIVFYTAFTGVNYTSITDYEALRAMGDGKINTLVSKVNTSGTEKSCSSQATASFYFFGMALGILLLV